MILPLLGLILLGPCDKYVKMLHYEQALNEPAVLSCVELRLRTEGRSSKELLDLAWGESRFQPDVVSSAGAVGIGQVLPQYWCEEPACQSHSCCDTVGAMLRAYDWHKSRFGARWKACYKGKCKKRKASALPANPETLLVPRGGSK